jgi:hypothetical protein
MQAIERTPPLASASKIAPNASAEATAEAINLESTLLGIDKILSDMAAEETAAAADVTPGFRRQTECEPCKCQDQQFTYTAVT